MIINFKENQEKELMKNIHLTLKEEQISKLETFSKYYDISKSEIIRQVINELELPNKEQGDVKKIKLDKLKPQLVEEYSERLQL